MDIRPQFYHAANALHGSVYFKVLDDVAFFAASSLVNESFVLSASFHRYFLRPVDTGALRADGRVVNTSRSSFTVESALYLDGDFDRQVAPGSGSFTRSRIRLADLEGYA